MIIMIIIIIIIIITIIAIIQRNVDFKQQAIFCSNTEITLDFLKDLVVTK